MPRILKAAGILTTLLILSSPTAARADEQFGEVRCGQGSSPECTLTAVDPGNDETTDASTGSGKCSLAGEEIPCANEAYGWYGGDGCYYGKDPSGFLPPEEWIKNCYDPATGTFTDEGVVLLSQPPGVLAATLRQAISRLGLSTPGLRASPALDGPQVVRVPVWYWVTSTSWRTRTASASVPGFTITARARAESLTIYPGDGSAPLHCRGRGSVWSTARSPQTSSPSCGHTYTTTSPSGQPFALRAEVLWQIDWNAPGMSGSESQTTTTDSPITVTELRSVIG